MLFSQSQPQNQQFNSGGNLNFNPSHPYQPQQQASPPHQSYLAEPYNTQNFKSQPLVGLPQYEPSRHYPPPSQPPQAKEKLPQPQQAQSMASSYSSTFQNSGGKMFNQPLQPQLPYQSNGYISPTQQFNQGQQMGTPAQQYQQQQQHVFNSANGNPIMQSVQSTYLASSASQNGGNGHLDQSNIPLLQSSPANLGPQQPSNSSHNSQPSLSQSISCGSPGMPSTSLKSLSSQEIISELKRLNYEEVSTKMLEPILKDTYWDPSSFEVVMEEFDGKARIYRAVVSFFTKIILPTYKDIHFESDKDLKESKYYNHLEDFAIYQVDSGISGIPMKVTPPYPLVGCTRKYTKYDKLDSRMTRHPFPKTIVKTFNDDTLVVAKMLHGETGSVCVLSMANQKKPGHGWLEGFVGQEEELFRKTTLSCGIDESFYPMNDYDSVFVENVFVIREGEDENYVFLPPEERYTVDVISMCGLNLGDKGRKEMTPEQIDVVRLKVRSMLIACIENRARNLVLGALGCGIFENDPVTVAKIFEAELTVFAGFFDKVYFAILDEDTKKVFHNVLVGEDMEERAYTPRISWFREYVRPTLGSVTTKCEKGAMCTDTSLEHLRDMDHLPLCFDFDGCTSTDPIHRLCFRHKEECPHGASCTEFQDEIHTRYFKHEHFQLCHERENCTDISPGHLAGYLHYPICEKGKKCEILGDHKRKFRHLDICPEGTMCKMFFDEEHRAKYFHPFNKPCPDDPFGFECESKEDEHFKKYLHVCFDGPSCPQIGDPEHCQCYSHARPKRR